MLEFPIYFFFLEMNRITVKVNYLLFSYAIYVALIYNLLRFQNNSISCLSCNIWRQSPQELRSHISKHEDGRCG